MQMLSREKRRGLAARARAELALRQPANRGHIDLGEGPVFYDGMPKLTVHGRILAGAGLHIYSAPIQPQLTVEEGAELRMGDGVGINNGVNIYSVRSIEIGDGAMVGPMVSIYDTNFHPIDEGKATKKAPVKIGRNVWLGHSVVVLPGVEIGDHSVVAAGSIVARDVPPRSVAGGNPATVLRELSASDGWRRNSDPG
jgi:acetyltransferase-like isoleucine patch superfamily enzyme